ncbi:tuftelin-interacting protein 11 [Nilaparvata lugens]|uniref:tuftelin-interacting protein 11 n=1 Tax=Nilaparvata lugens TaxID=108931 RepID=UPI00193D0214|nr:tuftelin-interacting protein 11 [Nilaparvata lugens]
MSDEELESFEVTDFDLENEFNINRKQFRQTKNQAIYGEYLSLSLTIGCIFLLKFVSNHGAYGPEKAKKKEQQEKELQEAKGGKKGSVGVSGDASLSQWRKDGGNAAKKKNVQYVYKSIEDVLEESKYPSKGKREFSELAKVKVIDMTGPEQRVLSGYHAISGVKKPSEQWELRREKKFTNFELPELQHNLDLLVEMCEEAIVQNNKQTTYTEDRSVTLENELKNLEIVESQEAQSIETLEKVLAIVEDLMQKSDNHTLTLDLAAEAFHDLQTNYMSEYCAYEVQSLALGLVVPLIKDQLSTWSVLQQPCAPLGVFGRWQQLLSPPTAGNMHFTADHNHSYHKLVWDAWMPSIRIAVSTWNCRDYSRMLELVEAWRGVIPGWTLDNIISDLIVPKLQREVDDWNPVQDTIPIHTWIHPWLPLIGTKALETSVFPTIRHKLSVALVNWHPSDPSARLMLTPWQGVFNRGQMDAFLVNNIVPKLHQSLQQLVINPHQQHLDNWKWVMDWSEMIPVYSMASILDKSFFPKWMQVLSLWLNVAQPNYDQVSNWYQGWKAMIPDRLLKEPSVQEHLNTALTMMSRSAMAAAGGGGTSMAVPSPPPAQMDNKYQKAAECTRTSNQVPHGFKDLVEKKCEELGILWAPLPNRYREAKQIYKCGNVQCYIDRNVLFVCDVNTGVWAPLSLQQMLDKAVK